MFKDRQIEVKLVKPPSPHGPAVDELVAGDRLERHIDHVVEVGGVAATLGFGAFMCVKVYNTFDEILITIVKSKFK